MAGVSVLEDGLWHAGEPEAANAIVSGAAGASSTRETKLAKLVETLKGRLEVLRGENKQLEELLQAADNRASGNRSPFGTHLRRIRWPGP